jgi:hypothetical protein
VARYAITAGLALVASCASASPEPADPMIDAPKPPMIDAPIPIDAPPVDLCPGPSTCQTATVLSSLSGDTGSGRLPTQTGHQSAWFRVRVTEDSISSIALSLSAKLTSPAAVDFDVFIYVNVNNDVVECTTKLGMTTTSGNVDTTRAVWGDTGFSGDDRNVSIEVRPVSGTCAQNQTWQLEIIGNT